MNINKLAIYLIIGASAGFVVGLIICFACNNIFFQVASTGLGISLGMLLGDLVYVMKKNMNK